MTRQTTQPLERLPLSSVLVADGDFNSVADEARIYTLINGGGTPQTDTDMARARRVAEGT